MMKRRQSQSGQALIELALVIFIFLIMTMGWIGEGIQIVARVEVSTALRLAAVAATQAPRGDSTDGETYAGNTFESTMQSTSWITVTFAGCSGPYLNGQVGNGSAGSDYVTCTATNAVVNFQRIGPLAMVWPSTIPINNGTLTATVYPSPHRTCINPRACAS